MSGVLSIRNKNGEFVPLPVIIGQQGADGKSAYQLDVEAGFEGTVEEWLKSIRSNIQLIGNSEHNGSFINLNGIISSPIVGSVEENNVIILSGNLDKGVYEIRFNLANGNTATICAVEVV